MRSVPTSPRMISAATAMAPVSRKLCAAGCTRRSDSTSCRSVSSPRHKSSSSADRSTSLRASAERYTRSTRRQRSEGASSSLVIPSRVTARQFLQQPHLRGLPLAHDRLRRDLQHLRGLLDTQSAKESHLDDATLARIDGRKRGQGIVERDQVTTRFRISKASSSMTACAPPPRF